MIKDERLPIWYKAALFNELYYVVAGGRYLPEPCSMMMIEPLSVDDFLILPKNIPACGLRVNLCQRHLHIVNQIQV